MAYYKEGVIQRFIGASTDTKPTLQTSSAGSKFYETDTKLTYIWSGAAWTVNELWYGLVFGGTCDAGMTASTTDLYCADLAGYGNDYFNQKFYVQIIKNTDAIGVAPDNEIRLITDYVSATGKFVCDAFSANVEETDEIYVLHKLIASPLIALPTEIDAFILTDYDDFDIADADADTERWTPGYITGTEGGAADINTTTAGKLRVGVDPDATPTEARYGVLKKLAVPADYFTIMIDLDVTFGATDSATAKAAGLLVSAGTTYDANNFIALERQKGTAINRIQARATFNSVGQTAANFTTTDIAVALKIERWDNVWRLFYSTVQAPVYSWQILTQFEDASDDMTGEVCLYFQAYSVGSADAESVLADFDNFKLYIGAGGGGQYIAGDYDSAHVNNDVDGNLFERIEAVQRAMQVVAGGGTGFEADASGATQYNVSVSKYGEADAGGDADTLVDAALTEANDFYNGQFLAFLSGNNAGLARPIVDQVLASTSLEVRPAFPNAIVAGEKYVILTRHEIQTPAANSAENYMPRDVVGNKADTAPAMNAAPADTDSVVKHLKALRETVGQEPADDDSSIHTILGQPDDAIPAMNAAPGNDSVVEHVKAILERVGATPADGDDSLLTTAGQRDDAASVAATATIIALLRGIIGALNITAAATGTGLEIDGTPSLVTALGTDGANVTDQAASVLGAIGANNADNAFDSTNVVANANGSVLERLKDIVTTYLADGTIGLAAIEALVDDLEASQTAQNGATGIAREQADVAVAIDAILASETTVFDLSTATTRYIVRHLRLKSVDPGAETITVRLYELVNDVLTAVDSYAITTANYTQYHSLMDMFGLPQLAGDNLKVTVQASAAGPYAITGQYSFAKTNN